ncbi:MAG: hypothetical protein QM479_05975 [Pseudomonadota bacterium]
MEIPSVYLSIIAEAAALALLLLLGFIFLLKRDKSNLVNYVAHLKEKIKHLTKKIKELDSGDNSSYELISDTTKHIKSIYEEKFGHEIGTSESTINEDNSKDHFLHVFGYQALKATLTSLENSNTAAKTWEKITAQISVLIENFRIFPETQYETIIEQQVVEKIKLQDQQQSTSETPQQSKSIDNIAQKQQLAATKKANPGSDQFIKDRKNEINRLKGQISSQFEEIWQLQNNISNKLSSSTDTDVNSLSGDISSVSRQLKDAELCITMMEADIATSDEEITGLKEQLERANIKASAIPPSNSELTEEIKKKDALIARFAQESKEMITLIDGMEQNTDEQAKRIFELEAQLKG